MAGAVAASSTGRIPDLAQRARELAEEIDAEARQRADQDDARQAAAAPEPQRETRGHEHHRREQRGHAPASV